MFAQRLRNVSHHHESRAHLPSTAEEMVALIAGAGFVIDRVVGSGQAARDMQWAPKEASNRAIIVATRPGAD